MNLKTPSIPFYARLCYIIVILIGTVYVVILAKKILVPLFFAFLFSILLLPIAGFLEKKIRFPRSLASITAVLLLICAATGLLYLLGSEIGKLSDDWPKFKEQLNTSFSDLQEWISKTFKMGEDKQMDYVHQGASKFLSSGSLVFGTTLLSITSILFFLTFTFIYTFFFLTYRRHILKFLLFVCKEQNAALVNEIVKQTQYIMRRYVIGLLIEMTTVASICCVAFLSLGIEYAVLLGLITGLFNLVPYLGVFSALMISLLITFASTGALSKVIIVFVITLGTHLIDANILLPLIVGSKVKINAFITILGVIAGEMIWGIAGMFLSIPIIAVIKIVFDRIEGLKPWGFLLGEEEKNKLMNKIKAEVHSGTS